MVAEQPQCCRFRNSRFAGVIIRKLPVAFPPYFEEKRRSGHDDLADIIAVCQFRAMKAFLPLALLLGGADPVDHLHTYLLSIGHIPLKDTESIAAFSIKTWGVEAVSVCHIPTGWEIKAGNRTTPDGDIDGEGSNGVTWFHSGNPKELQNLVLVTMYGPVQRYTVGQRDNGVPATFEGSVTINGDDSELSRALIYKNIALRPAHQCPRIGVR